MNGQFDIGALTPGRYFFPIAILLGLLFALVSAEQGKSAGIIFLQWQLQTVLPMALLIGVHLLLSSSDWFDRLNPWLALTISGLAGASLFAPLALAIESWLDVPAEAPFLQALIEEWIAVVPPVAICWIALNAPWILGYRFEKVGMKADFAGPLDTLEFMALLPPDKRGRPVMMKSELHYLRVVTESGSALILYNLGDAVRQIPDDIGMLVHRSYWVALESVEELNRRGREGELRLRDGSRVPVSRNRLAEVTRRLQPRGG
jgi:hypothetical protein